MKKIIVAIIAAMLLLSPIAYSVQNPPIIDEALLHLEKPYKYKKAGPNSFDCSGLVYYCYKKVENIQLKRSAKEQGYDEEYEKIKEIKDLQIGDIVFFNTNKRDGDFCDHAGLYLGNGEFIHSSSSKGKVIISTLSEGYYNEVFSWGRRIKEVTKNEHYDKTWFTRQYSDLRALLRHCC